MLFFLPLKVMKKAILGPSFEPELSYEGVTPHPVVQGAVLRPADAVADVGRQGARGSFARWLPGTGVCPSRGPFSL